MSRNLGYLGNAQSPQSHTIHDGQTTEVDQRAFNCCYHQQPVNNKIESHFFIRSQSRFAITSSSMAQVKALREELQKIAHAELDEEPSRISEALQDLKAWIEQQPHLKARTDDQFLLQFLRGCKFNMEEAQKKLDYFYAFKTKLPDFAGTTNVDRPKFRAIHNLGCVAVLPTPMNGCGPRIVVYRYLYPTDKYRMEEVIEVCCATLELLILNDPYACICGVIYVLDMAKLTLNHVLQYRPIVLRQLAAFYEKYLPLRTKSFCFVNVPMGVEQFFKLYLQSLSPDFRQRVFICGKNMSKLTEQIPLKYLPQDYGGANGSLDQLVEGHNKVLDDNRDYFRQNEEYGTDERLRVGKPIDFDGLIDEGGSFRKLNVD